MTNLQIALILLGFASVSAEQRWVCFAVLATAVAGIRAEYSPLTYLLIDATAATALTLKGPGHSIRRAVKWLFVLLAVLDLCLFIASYEGRMAIHSSMIAIGLAMLGLLAVWIIPPALALVINQLRSPQEMRHEGV